MADYTFGLNDEENAELKKMNAEVVRNPCLYDSLSARAAPNMSFILA